jgi:hypothetical protein
MPIGLVFVDCSLKHGFYNFVDFFKFPIRLWVIG